MWLQASYGKQGAEQEAARRALAEDGSGKLHKWLGRIDVKLGKNPYGWAVGDQLSMADLRAFCEFSSMISGWYTGLPANMLDRHANIQNHRAKISVCILYQNDESCI